MDEVANTYFEMTCEYLLVQGRGILSYARENVVLLSRSSTEAVSILCRIVTQIGGFVFQAKEMRGMARRRELGAKLWHWL